jgi:DNA-binding Xre family transcriptional regulator
MVKKLEFTQNEIRQGLIQYVEPGLRPKPGPQGYGTCECRLQAYCELRGVSLLALSNASGVPYSNLHKLATGKTKNLSFKTLGRICVALNCQVSDFIVVTPKRVIQRVA